MQKKYSAEALQLIDIIDSPLRIDVINQGENTIVIKKLFVDGILDDNYITYDGNTLESSYHIPHGTIIVIEPSIIGGTITIITENDKKFSFE